MHVQQGLFLLTIWLNVWEIKGLLASSVLTWPSTFTSQGAVPHGAWVGAAPPSWKHASCRQYTAMQMSASEDEDDATASSNGERSPEGPVIPDAIRVSDIQARLDDIKRRRGSSTRAGKGRNAAGDSRLPRSERVLRGQPALAPKLPYAVWVLVFNGTLQPGTHQGIYCLWVKGVNSVVAFEGREGALRYSLELRAQGLGMPSPSRVAMKDLHRFCDNHSFDLKLVPIDVVPVAPDKTKPELGYQIPLQGDASPSNDGSLFTPEDVERFRDSFERLYLRE